MPTLNWIGKDKVVNHHLDVPFRVLEEQYTFGDNADGNMIIHGDNLDALKALLPRFEGRVKCIYIDPPYNTGIEGWVYNDNVNDPKIRKWLGEVVGREGEDLSRHDKWLCMMKIAMSRAKAVAMALILTLLFTVAAFLALAETEPPAQGGKGDVGRPAEHGPEARGSTEDDDLPEIKSIYLWTPTPESTPTPAPEATGEAESENDSGVKRMYEALFQRIASICGSEATIQEGVDAYTRYRDGQ